MSEHNYEYIVAAFSPDRSDQLRATGYSTLNEMGAAGWELVTQMASAEPGWFSLVFKRRLRSSKHKHHGHGHNE